MFKTKAKGSKAERELLHKFWNNEWACVRVAGSGSTSFPAPDLLASNGSVKIALECKAIKQNNRYLAEEEVSQLRLFSQKFGAEPWLAIKFNHKPWYFLRLEDLNKTNKKWSISLNLAEQKGIKFEHFLKRNQTFLKRNQNI
jgi:Holliday junction resolvase